MNRRPSVINSTRRCPSLHRFVKIAVLLAVLPGLKVFSAEPASGPRSANVIATVAEWIELEAQVRKTVQMVLPSVVAVGVSSRIADWSVKFPHFEHFASGVIIRGDGLILSQWHVSHKLGTKTRDSGDSTEVILHDGRRLKAELLGADRLRDLSLLRIVPPGKYPHAEFAENNSVSLGDWVLKLGHPNGYRANRGAVSRLGRVLFLGQTIDIVADCQAAGGDSGGPLFNLDGQVVGILGSTPQGTHFFPSTRHFVSPWCYTNIATIRELIRTMLNFNQDAASPPSEFVLDSRSFRARNPQLTDELVLSDANVGDPRILLPLDQWRQGRKTRSGWHDLTGSFSKSVVEVLRDNYRVALGTVVGADGWILTKASEISEQPHCRLANGKIVLARVMGTDAAYDLALLKIDAIELHAVEWNKEGSQPAGTLLAALDGQGDPMALGIISVSQRFLEGPFPAVIAETPRRGPPPLVVPEVTGQSIAGKGFVISFVQGSAAEAGIHARDVLLSIDNRPIRRSNDLKSSIQGHFPGDKLLVAIKRDGQPAEIIFTLKAEPYMKSEGTDQYDQSFRRDNFPVVFEHDIPLWLDECGGPVIGLNGKAIGITIARVGQHGCMAIPADVIEPLIQHLKSQNRDSVK